LKYNSKIYEHFPEISNYPEKHTVKILEFISTTSLAEINARGEIRFINRAVYSKNYKSENTHPKL